MCKAALLAGILLFVPLAAHAQKNEIFAGYSFLRMEAHPSNMNLIGGWEGSYTYQLSSFYGINADASGDYGTVLNSRMNFHSYLIGPQIHIPLPRHFSPFVHLRFGWSRLSFQGIITDKFTSNVGGGMDYRASDSISFRLIEADFITGNFTQSSPESRFSTGIVFRF
ncbi:MAG TPA: hypothetical protein VGT03_03110 [Candidatus Acidoferrales bacterium]|nr:hypothetical protein [Candidatus Acidoferrales bacterium]